MSNQRKEKEGKSEGESVFKRYDIFGQTEGFNLTQESPEFKSSAGTVLTAIVFLITILFTIQSIIVLQKRNGTLFMTAVKTNKNDDSRIFTEEDGF